MEPGASISPFSDWIFSFLDSSPNAAVKVLFSCAIYWFFILSPIIYLLHFLERKLAANIHMRLGPNRVGPFGVFQGISDHIKIIFKSGNTSAAKNGMSFIPTLVIALLFTAITAIPVATQWQITELENSLVFICFVFIITKLFMFWNVYSAQGRFSELAAYRIIFDLIAALVPILVSIISICTISGTLDFTKIIELQGGAPWRWNLFHDPGSFVGGAVFYISFLIWSYRGPFGGSASKNDLFGGASEGASGLSLFQFKQIEAMGFIFGLSLFVVLYLGGGKTPFSLDYFGKLASVIEFFVFCLKFFILAMFSFWIRWSLSELRADQATQVAFNRLLPISLLALIITVIWMTIFSSKGLFDLI